MSKTNQRDNILETARQLMSRHGSAATSMRNIAQACGINVAAIYHYFPSKDALIEAVIEDRRYGDRLLDLPTMAASATPSERVELIFQFIWEGAIAERETLQLLFGEVTHGETALLASVAGVFNTFRDALVKWINDSVPELDHAEELADMMIGQLFASFLRFQIWPTEDPVLIGKQAARLIAGTVNQ